MKLRGRPIKLGIVVVGGQSETIDSQIFKLSMLKEDGKVVNVEAYGIEKISSEIEKIDIPGIATLFNASVSDIHRPTAGEIDVLIGQQYAALHPVRCKSSGHLLLLRNDFGLVIAGAHPHMSVDASISSACLQVRNATVMHTVGVVDKFFDIEGLGVMCQPQCGGCRCGKCHPGGKNMSLKEEKEYAMIEEGLTFDDEKGRWTASYPWIKSPDELPNNRSVALAILRSTEKRLRKDEGLAQLYSEQIVDMVKRKAARIVTEEELMSYDGPKFYISHFEVLNPKSRSTPCRIVYNSSARYRGHSLNDYLAKGPSLLNRLFRVLLRFREGRCAFIGDISKMFHAIDIPLREQMTHLFLWRSCQQSVQPDTYAMTAVSMGDRPSATIAQVALRKSAEEAAIQFPDASTVIIENAYMDDIPASTNSDEESTQLMFEIETILSSKGFKIKEWIRSGSINPCNITIRSDNGDGANTEGVLGVMWQPGTDVLRFEVSPPEQDDYITKRKILSIINKIYDPLGLLAPFTVKLKVLMRKIWAKEPKCGWDDELPMDIKEEWIRLMSEFDDVSQLSFKRSLVPKDAVGKPILVLFSDGSEDAFGAVAYARWRCEDGQFASRLIAAKTRMAPLKVVDIVRIELCGAVLSKRLRATIENDLNMGFEKSVHIIDSEIVQAMIRKESYGFNTFAANRIGEIQELTSAEEWMWIAGKPWLNIADITTRGASPIDLAEDSMWQQGPAFLALPEEEWPVKRNPRPDMMLPERKRKFVGATTITTPTETLASRFDISRFSKWKLLIHTTARILKLYERFKTVEIDQEFEPEISAGDLETAKYMWIKEAQQGLKLGDNMKLRPTYENGIIVVGGRTERWMQATWNQQKFILLPKNHAISKLIMWYEHVKGGHLGVAASIAKVRSIYWILGINKTMKAMISNCVKCKRMRLNMCSQIMSPLPIERIQPNPPFTNIGVDYFGPFEIKGEIQKRVRGKGYGVIFTCLCVRAVYVDVANDFSTDAFLQVLRRFSTFRGWPKKIFSDNGTQLVGASKELQEVITNLDWQKIKSAGISIGIEWTFSPGNAPWYNGATEALVKTTKRALNASIGENVMTFSELLTCMFEAAELVNERPIGMHPSNPDDGTYLCPNDMLLGRSTSKVPQGPFLERTSYQYRFDFIQSIVEAFWKRWTREVFPSLVIQNKWHTAKWNLKAGDVVLVQDSNAVRGEWKMARVVEPKESADGKVRRVTIAYRTITGSRQEVERPVQKLILLATDEIVH